MKLIFPALLAAVALAFAVSGLSRASKAKALPEPFVLNAVTNNPKISGMYQGIVLFKKLVEDRSDGRIRVEILVDAVLGDEEQLAVGMQEGIVDFTVHSSAKYANFVPEMDIYSAPYTFRNWGHMKAVIGSEVNDKLVKTVMERRGDHFVGVYTEGLRNVFTRKEIRRLDDLRGLKIRAMTGPSELDAWRALGADPAPTAYPALFSALASGQVDGAENTMTSILGMRFFESSKYVLRTAHNYMAMPVILSGRFLKKLPEELRGIVIQAARDSASLQLDWAIEYDRRNEKILKELHGVKVTEFNQADQLRALEICRNLQIENARRIHMEKEQQLIAMLAEKY